MNRSDDFRRTVRTGVRAGRRTLVVHTATAPEGSPPAPQVGFVVSKAVGNAVTRNRVKRVLRHAVRAELDSTPGGTRFVIRALPPAATSPELAADLASAWRQGLRRLTGAEGSGAPAGRLATVGSTGT